MRVAAAAATIQARYEAGDISYPRTAARTLGPAGAAHVMRLGVAKPALVTQPLGASRRPHEAVHVLREEMPGFAGVPQHLLPEEMRFLDRVARATVRASMPLQIERPDTTQLPEWARDLPWWRPGPEFAVEARSAADGCDFAAQAEIFDFDAEEVAFEALAREALGRPSSIADHAVRAVERGFVDAHGVTALGLAALEDVPPSLTLPGIALAVEEVIEADSLDGAPEGPPGDLVERCFGVMPELAPRLRAALKRGGGTGGSEMKPSAPPKAAASDGATSEAERAYWEGRRLEASIETRAANHEAHSEDDRVPPADVFDRHGASRRDEGDLGARAAAVEELNALDGNAGQEWTWLTPDAPVALESEDEEELEPEDERTSYAAPGPQPW